jgi:hypothetical protein
VTVSIAAETIGVLMEMFREKRVTVLTWVGRTLD